MLLPGSRFRRALRRAPWWLFLPALVWSVASAQVAGVAGTLPEDYLPGLKPILVEAMRQSPQMILQQITIAQNEAQVYQADSQRWPSVGGNVRYDSNQTGVSSGGTSSRDSGLFYSFSINQALFHWGEIKNQGRIARIQVAIAQKNYAEAYRVLATQLRVSYVGLVQRNAFLRQARYDLKLKQAQLAALKERLKNGTASPGDIAGMTLGLSETQLHVDQLQADFDNERHRFSRLAGIPDIPADKIPDEMPVPQFHQKLASRLLAGFLSGGADDTFKAQVAEMNARAARLQYKIARVRLLPKFDAGVQHSRESSTTATPTEVTQTAITRDTFEVRGNWNIFDGFATKGAKLQARADERYWEKERQIETDSAMDEAQQLARTVALDARAADIAKQRQDGAALLLRRAEEAMKAGTASQDDVNNATNTLRLAQANSAVARATYLSDWSAFVSRVADDPILNNLPPRYVRENQ